MGSIMTAQPHFVNQREMPISCSGSPHHCMVMSCSESVRPLEPMQNRPPHETAHLEDGGGRQPEPSVPANVGQQQAGTTQAVIPAEPPAAHKLASVELIPRAEPVFRPVRAFTS